MIFLYGQIPAGARPAYSWPKYSLVGSIAVEIGPVDTTRRQGRRAKALVREADLAALIAEEDDLLAILQIWTVYLNE